jgi:hypothetical protein
MGRQSRMENWKDSGLPRLFDTIQSFEREKKPQSLSKISNYALLTSAYIHLRKVNESTAKVGFCFSPNDSIKTRMTTDRQNQ